MSSNSSNEYLELAKVRHKAYLAFCKTYEDENPPPSKPRLWQFFTFTIIGFALVSISAILLSSFRTGPVFKDIAKLLVTDELLATIEMAFAIIIIELFFVISRFIMIVWEYKRTGEIKDLGRWLTVAFWSSFLMALIANVYGGTKGTAALQEHLATINLVIGLLTGIAAPLLAFVSGEILGNLWVQMDKEYRTALAAWQVEYDQWEAARKEAWDGQSKALGLHKAYKALSVSVVQPQLSAPTVRSDTPADADTGQKADKRHGHGQGYSRTHEAQQRVLDYLAGKAITFDGDRLYIDGERSSVRDLAEATGIGKTVAGDVVKRMRAASLNGHPENGHMRQSED